MELKITKEKVLEAASKCSTAKATLETLFPECFEPVMKDIDDFEVNTESFDKMVFIGRGYVPDEYSGKVLCLNGREWEWEMNHMSNGHIMLIPTKK